MDSSRISVLYPILVERLKPRFSNTANLRGKVRQGKPNTYSPEANHMIM